MAYPQIAAATKQLHHAVEQTPFGEQFAAGTLPMSAYADWLHAMFNLHSTLCLKTHLLPMDVRVPEYIKRAPLYLTEDLLRCGLGNPPHLHYSYIQWPDHTPLFTRKADVLGSAYVLLGAHLMGGRVLKKLNPALPMSHVPDLRTVSGKAVMAYWKKELREHERMEDPAVINGANNMFNYLRECVSHIKL